MNFLDLTDPIPAGQLDPDGTLPFRVEVVMSDREIDVLVVGAGQAGVAMSQHLATRAVPHVVLERSRIAERWRTGRWDSLVANGPAWHDRFPGLEFDIDPDGFATKDEVADYFSRYVERYALPVHCGIEVISVQAHSGRPGFRVETTDGTWDARAVVAATGAFQTPVIPPVVPATADLAQIHSSSYRAPELLPEGAVLVIGAGSSGVQIADELRTAGREVYLSVGPHDRPPRAYRGKDFVWWLGVLNKWEAATPPLGAEHVTIAVSGANGGRTIDFRDLAASGITLVGRTTSYRDGIVHFAPDLRENILRGDANHLSLLDEADAHVTRNGLDLPEEPGAHVLGPLPDAAEHPIAELDLNAAGVKSIVWSTGYSSDYSWLPADAVDDLGKPRHQRGVSTAPGIYFLGLPWQSRRGSSFIWGVWHDAGYLADQIEIQRSYARHTTLVHLESATETGVTR